MIERGKPDELIGVGICWTGGGNPRPRLWACHLSTYVGSLTSARAWLDLFAPPQSAREILRTTSNWELYSRFPMIRGKRQALARLIV